MICSERKQQVEENLEIWRNAREEKDIKVSITVCVNEGIHKGKASM